MHDCVYNVIHYEFVYTFSVALVMFQRYVFIAVSSSSVCKAAGNNENLLTETNASNGVNSVQEMELYTLMNSIETNTRYSRTSERMNDTVVLGNLSKTKKNERNCCGSNAKTRNNYFIRNVVEE